jgi:CheY-like chemotaxis protein
MMSFATHQLELSTVVRQRTDELFREHQQRIYIRTDRMFAVLLVFQWVAGIAAAVWISPRAWVVAESHVHPHVWAAVALAGLINSLPVALAIFQPGKTLILLSPDAPKLAVLDWMMPGMDGTQLCQDIRRLKPEPYTYILLLTGKRAQVDIISGLDAGADDYVTKPFDPAELQVRLRTGKRILFLQEQLISAREALRDQATHDRLTGLWNHAAIIDILKNELQRAQREGVPVAVVMGCAFTVFYCSMDDMLVGISGHSSAAGA